MNVQINTRLKASIVALLLLLPTVLTANALDVVIKTAPIVPHGLIAGEPFDITMSMVDLDPAIPGIPLKKGGTVKVKLPSEITNLGYPVSRPGDAKGCEPPVLAKCSSGGMLDGWPQSPLLPMSTIDYDEQSHTLILTSAADSAAYSLGAPGFKLVHLFTFGFKNPDNPGEYPIEIEIQPDPTSSDVLTGSAMLAITDQRIPNVGIDTTQSIHLKGPRYQNTMFQILKPGDTSRNMSANLWDAQHQPIVGASISMTSDTAGYLLSNDGEVIGALDIKAPQDAKGFYLLRTPSFAAKTGLAGYPTGRLVAALRTAPKVTGDYVVTLSLKDGNSIEHTLRVQ